MATPADTQYLAAIQTWRKQREESLTADDGWLTVSGLHWLEPGNNTVEGQRFVLSGRQVTLDGALLKPDVPGPADMITRGDLTLFVIARGGRFAIRVRDKQSVLRKQFRGLRWYPVQPEYRVTAKWTPYEKPQPRSIPTVVGIPEEMLAPGVAEFSLHGQTLRLEPVLDGRRLFFIFKDPTAGRTTYPAGRFLYTDPPVSGTVILDFNTAYTPPCGFTPYATCPLPPRVNHLAVVVEAGEMSPPGH